MSVTFRLRGEFRKFADRDSVTVQIPSPGPLTLEAAVACLLSQVSAAGEDGAAAHGSNIGGGGVSEHGIATAAFFCDGRLLRLQDQIHDGCTIHILSPLAGG